MEIIRSVPIQLYSYGKAVKPNEKWELGIWRYTDEIRIVWGLVHWGYPTHMCYDLSYAKPQECITRLENRNNFYFDVGNEFTVTKEDLEQAFKDLGIWEGTVSTPPLVLNAGDDDYPLEPTHDITTCADINTCDVHGCPF